MQTAFECICKRLETDATSDYLDGTRQTFHLLIDDGRISRSISDVRLAPNDKPSDQENHWQKNRRSNSQPASEPTSLDLRETSDRRDMGRISSPEPIKRQYSRDDAAVDQDIGNARHRWNDIEEEVLLFG